jgi:hypothetical protein
MYYIYHIKGVKIGCSTEPDVRVLKQGYTHYELLETHTDIDVVSDRERELQKQYGYKVDATPYKQSYEWATKAGFEARSKGGKNAGEVNKLNGHMNRIQILGGKVMGSKQGKVNKESGHMANLGKINSNKIHTCPHCGKVGKSSSMFQWHFDKCRNKKG